MENEIKTRFISFYVFTQKMSGEKIEAEVEPAMERIKVEGEEGEVEGWRFHYQVQLYALL